MKRRRFLTLLGLAPALPFVPAAKAASPFEALWLSPAPPRASDSVFGPTGSIATAMIAAAAKVYAHDRPPQCLFLSQERFHELQRWVHG